MSPDDVIPLGDTGMWARRAVVDAWTAAGSPPVNSATRLEDEQQELYDGWQAGLPGYAPADNPADTTQALAHVRGVALDITPTPERVAALEAAGLVRPYPYEEWHWQLPGDVRRFPLITTYPIPETIQQLGDVMSLRIISSPAYRAADQRVIHNGSSAAAIPAGWTTALILQGHIDHADYDADHLLEAEVNLVWQLGGYTAEDAAKRTAALLSGVKE